MSARPVIQTYRLASLHEAAIARLKNPKNDRYKELYLQNRGIGEKVYNAVLSGRLDLACFLRRLQQILFGSDTEYQAGRRTPSYRDRPERADRASTPHRSQATRTSGMRRDGRRRFRCLTVHGTGNPRCRWIQDATRSEFQSRQMQGRSSTARR